MRRRWQAALGIQAAVGQASWLGVRLMVSYLALEVSGEAIVIAVLASAFALAGLVAAIPAGRLADRHGGAVVGSGGLCASLGGVTVAVLVPTVPGMLVAALVLGLGHVGTLVGQQSLVAQAAPAGRSDAAFGTLSAYMSFGQLLGPPAVAMVASAAAPAGAPPDTAAGLLVCAGFILVALPAFVLLRGARPADRADRPARRTRAREVLRIPGMRRSLVVSGSVIVAVDLLASFLPAWAVERGIDPVTVGWLLALRALVTIGSRFGMARLVARFGRPRLIATALGLAVVALVALPFAGALTAVPVMILLGVGLGLPQPLTMAWVAALAPAGAQGAAMGLRMTGNRFAQFAMPLAIGATAGAAGVAAIFWTTAALLAAAGGLAITRRET